MIFTGASGFIGRALALRVLADGHAGAADGRSAFELSAGAGWLAADFMRDHASTISPLWLAGVGGVVDAVGIFR